MNPKKIVILVVAVLAVVILLSMAGSLFETNDMGWYQIKQAAITGKMTVRNLAGTYGQFFGKITAYQVSDIVYFSKHLEEFLILLISGAG